MTPQDMDKVWALLGRCRLGDPHLKDKTLKAAWWLVLEPYDYPDVREAIAAHFREKRFWPEVGEVTQHLPPVPSPAERRKRQRDAERMRRDLERIKQKRRDPDERSEGDFVGKRQRSQDRDH